MTIKQTEFSDNLGGLVTEAADSEHLLLSVIRQKNILSNDDLLIFSSNVLLQIQAGLLDHGAAIGIFVVESETRDSK
jgi:hypothetical protein